MKILIADDSITNRELLVTCLKKLGHEVTAAENGQQAIEMFKRNLPDLIILDVVMGEMDGYECAKKIRALDSDIWIPIIFLSANVDDESIAKGIQAGGDDYLTKPFSDARLAAKIKAMQRIADMRSKLFEATQKLSALSSTDVLTGLYNRLKFEKTIEELMSTAVRHKNVIALIFLDLDNFKTVNDTFGHHTGDLLLKEVAMRLKSCLRTDDFISRLGGDEFAIILTHVESPDIAGQIANNIINKLAPVYTIEGHDLHISSSIGIAFYPSDETSHKTFVQSADVAMYYAKESGRNNYKYFTQELYAKHQYHTMLQNELTFALERNQLELNYQPIFDLQTKKLSRIEALLSWNHPEFGLVPANDFIPIAEENGLITSIGTWVIKTICQQEKIWYKTGFINFKLSVNISYRQLLQNDFSNFVSTLLIDENIPTNRFELELAESTVMDNFSIIENVLSELNKIGISLAIDNFGTGYSSLQRLKQLPISTLKIDKSVIKDISKDKNHAMIVKTLIALGKNLDLRIVAEGIETKEQLQFLIENNCPEGQGYFLSKPINAKQMTDLLHELELKPYHKFD